MQTLWLDLRFGGRMLAKHPGLTLIALITLALGIGANTAIFSAVNAILLRPIPYPESERLVWLSEREENIPSRWVSYPNFLDWQQRSQSFEALAAYRKALALWPWNWRYWKTYGIARVRAVRAKGVNVNAQ